MKLIAGLAVLILIGVGVLVNFNDTGRSSEFVDSARYYVAERIMPEDAGRQIGSASVVPGPVVVEKEQVGQETFEPTALPGREATPAVFRIPERIPHPAVTPGPSATPGLSAGALIKDAYTGGMSRLVTPSPTRTPRPTRPPVPTKTVSPTVSVVLTKAASGTWPSGSSSAASPGDLIKSFVGSTALPPVKRTPVSRDAETRSPVAVSKEGLRQQRIYLLGLINEVREAKGLPAVALGDNEAAQSHAESMLENGFTGHWGLDGMTAPMRYTLAGGVNYVKENTSGVRNTKWSFAYETQGWKKSIEEAHRGLLGSPGHRKTILDKWNRKVSLGIACNAWSCSVVQNFEGDYVEFTKRPAISKNGTLSFAGELESGLMMSGVQVWYHEPPKALTLGQIDAGYSYTVGQEPATFIALPGYYGPSGPGFSEYVYYAGVDPYSVSADIGRGGSLSRSAQPRVKSVPWIVADRWNSGVDSSFSLRVNIKETIDDLGPGVYIVLIWGKQTIWGKGGPDEIPLTNYAIFVE